AIHDFIRFHPDERVREHFSTLRDYHLPGFRNSRLPNGEPNYALTREATEEWLYQLVQLGPEKGGITSLKTIPIELNLEKHLQVPLKHCGATLTSLLVTTYGSKLLGVIDCLIHLSDSAVRSFYQEVDYYHFQHTSKSAYRSAKKPQDTTGWIEVNGGTHRPWRNVGVVYRSFSEALDLLTKDTVGFFGLRRVFEDLQVQTLQETKSQYGGSLDRAYNLVFHGARDHRDRERDPNPRTLFNLVLGGYLWSKEFEQFYANRSDRFKNGVVRDIEQARRSLADVERPGNGIVVPPWANGKSVSWESSSWGIYFGLEDRHQSTIVEAHRSFTKRPRIHSA
ncbi:MAG: hypothetical protein KDD60_09985, partial [Bdellovibrionales bacterium]|nr:hypothetical protein [Bdellovibrionales bacterium]